MHDLLGFGEMQWNGFCSILRAVRALSTNGTSSYLYLFPDEMVRPSGCIYNFGEPARKMARISLDFRAAVSL